MLKSDHYGIESSVPDNGSGGGGKLKSDHYGIESLPTLK